MNHLGNAKCNCPYAVHGLSPLQDCRPARPPVPQQVPEESQPAVQRAGKQSKRRDASLTPGGLPPQQAQDFLVWMGWASGHPLAHVLGTQCPPAPATHTGQGAGQRPGCCGARGGQTRRHGACRTRSRAQTPWSAGQLAPAKLGRASRCPGGRARCLTAALGSLPCTLPGLPDPGTQLSVLRREDTGQGHLCQADGIVSLTHAYAGNKEPA